jgi:rhodanese-related sulfurtransferase
VRTGGFFVIVSIFAYNFNMVKSKSFMNQRLIFFIGFLIVSSIASGQVPDSLKYISVGPATFQEAYQSDSNAVLIDVREFFEYKKSRIDHAVNIPSSGNLDIPADTLNKESPLFFYCTSGFRSKRVAKHFYDKGFVRLYSLDGGINAWKKEGLAVNKKKIKK